MRIKSYLVVMKKHVMFRISWHSSWYKVVVQLLSCVQLFVTPWTATHQASLSFIISEFPQIHVH